MLVSGTRGHRDLRSFQGCNRSLLPQATTIRGDHLWASALSGAAGTGLQWYWNPYVEKHDLYRQYRGLAKFVADVDWPGHGWKPVKTTRPSQPVSLNVYGLAAGDRALVWIHDPLAFRVAAGKAEKGPARKGASVNVLGLEEGAYRVEFVDPRTGEVAAKDAQPVHPLRHFGHGIDLQPPEFWGDIAVKIIARGKEWKEPSRR